jgi:1-acyl-sn-glycerol-3-phosphate acyltransferase
VFYWLLKRIILGPVLFAVFRPWVKGEDNVPETGGAILASNHLSFSDSIFLPLVVKRRVTFLAKADYFTGSGIKGRLTAGFFRGVGQVPLDRSGGQASEAALETGLRVLRRGAVLGIYPEGTRSPDGRLYRGKTGVARMALEAKVPVLPVAMIGTDKVQPIGKKIPHLGRVGVVIGEPLDFSRYDGMEDDRFVLRSITDEIMYALMELSGQEYADVYASTMKERIAAARRAKAGSVAAAAVARVTAVATAAEEAAQAKMRGTATSAPAGTETNGTTTTGGVPTRTGPDPDEENDDAPADRPA